MSISHLELSQRNCKKAKIWTVEKRRHLLSMCGYFTKEEMAERLELTVPQVISMIMRMQASYRVTKDKKDYKR